MNDTASSENLSPLTNITRSSGAELLRAVVDEVRQMQMGWTMLGEESQNRVIDRLRTSVHQALQTSVRRVASAGFEHIVADVESLTIKDGAKATLLLERASPELHRLMDRVGSKAVIVFADPDKFTLGMELVRGDADQPQLPLDAELVRPVEPRKFRNRASA